MVDAPATLFSISSFRMPIEICNADKLSYSKHALMWETNDRQKKRKEKKESHTVGDVTGHLVLGHHEVVGDRGVHGGLLFGVRRGAG